VENYVFPNDTIPYRPYLYIYSYLNSTDLEASANDPYYGQPASEYLPEGYDDGSAQPILPAGGGVGGNPGLWEVVATVSVTVTNTGSVAGDEVAQLYVALGEGEPPKVLRGFERINIAAGGSAQATFPIKRRDISTWDVVSQNWIETENPTIYVGSSSRNLPLTGSLAGGSSGGGGGSGNGTEPYPPNWSETPMPSGSGVVTQISDGQPQAPTQT
jgi:beta-glucosidase